MVQERGASSGEDTKAQAGGVEDYVGWSDAELRFSTKGEGVCRLCGDSFFCFILLPLRHRVNMPNLQDEVQNAPRPLVLSPDVCHQWEVPHLDSRHLIQPNTALVKP